MTVDVLDAERATLLSEHADLTAAFEQLQAARPFDLYAHRDHLRKLHNHIARLHAYVDHVRDRAQRQA